MSFAGGVVSSFPCEYEIVSGERISPAWRGIEVPVPPEWVREWSTVTERYKYASLAKELEEQFPPEVRETLVGYVKDWTRIRETGEDLLIAGRVSHVQRVWASAAVMNEITMRYGPRMNLTTAWLSVRSGLTWLLESKTLEPERYLSFRNKLLHTKLLFIDNPIVATRGSDRWWFLQALYEHRFENKLPTITTLPFTWDEKGQKLAQRMLGRDIAYYLETNSANYLINWDEDV